MKRLLFSSLAAFGLTGAPAHAVMIDFSLDGNIVDIVVSDLGGQIVSAFDILVTYDSTALTALDAIVGDRSLGPDFDGHAISYLDDISAPLGDNTGWTIRGTDVSTPGEVSLFELSLLDDADLLAQQIDSFLLGSIAFDAVVEAAEVTLDSLAFVWDIGLELDVKGLNADPIFPVTGVPEPGTLLLLGSGLLGFGLSRRQARSH